MINIHLAARPYVPLILNITNLDFASYTPMHVNTFDAHGEAKLQLYETSHRLNKKYHDTILKTTYVFASNRSRRLRLVGVCFPRRRYCLCARLSTSIVCPIVYPKNYCKRWWRFQSPFLNIHWKELSDCPLSFLKIVALNMHCESQRYHSSSSNWTTTHSGYFELTLRYKTIKLNI